VGEFERISVDEEVLRDSSRRERLDVHVRWVDDWGEACFTEEVSGPVRVADLEVDGETESVLGIRAPTYVPIVLNITKPGCRDCVRVLIRNPAQAR
jgi:hypothetical protein